jgi:hypothetical protein
MKYMITWHERSMGSVESSQYRAAHGCRQDSAEAATRRRGKDLRKAG